ncbi:MAG TPA: DUF885 family protein, partial [Thermoanaerobaculia bacterium]|nr:DUF885 family protein [Thermoanaerobaculia bacterium]
AVGAVDSMGLAALGEKKGGIGGGGVRGGVLGLLLMVGLGCSGDEALPMPEPVGADRYGEILLAEGGVELGALELAGLAAADSAWISGRMDELAGRIDGGGSGWRELFERLRADHPAGAEGVLAAYRVEVERARGFVLARGLMTLPEAPLEVVETPAYLAANRYPLVAYVGYRLAVTVGERGRLGDHCRVCIPPLAVHETYPGHHAAFLHRRSWGGPGVEPDREPGREVDPEPDREVDPELIRRSAEQRKNRFFHEGWGQYAELLMLEAGYYAGEPERELGAWRSLLFRVERARIDALLQAGRLSPAAAAAEIAAFVDPATAEAEVARHLAEPTLKAAYYVGLLQVLELRRAVTAGDPEMDLRAFHDRFVRWPLPIPEVARERFGVEIGRELPEGGLARYLGVQ